MSHRPFSLHSGWSLLLFILFSLLSCHRYYMPVKQTSTDPVTSGKYIAGNSTQKYFIIRKGINSYNLSDISVDQVSMTLSGKLNKVDQEHRLYLNAYDERFKYKESEAGSILNEVHIYVNETTKLDSMGAWVLPLSQIWQIEVIQHDRKRTNSSYVLGGVGIGLGVMVLTGVILALTKSSCPFISVYDGNTYGLQGELFGGAVNAKLEREDYIPLKAAPLNGQFELRISNELKERQYTNFADLLIVEHPDNVQVFIDENGQPVSVSRLQEPLQASLNKRDVRAAIREKDGQFCGFNDTSASNGINELLLSFPKENNRNDGKLFLQLKNSYWFDYLYGEFTRKFGSNYSSWQEQQKKRPVGEMIRWTEEQQIPLSISVRTSQGWQEIRKLRSVGPLANRCVVMPFNGADIPGDKIEIRLRTGFMFWELDYAAVDYSSGNNYTVTRLKPVTAKDQNGNSMLGVLAADDQQYLSQPEPGEYANISYAWNRQPAPGNSYSVILHTKGYYEPVREYTGTPDMTALQQFREPGALAKFSLNRYLQIPKEQSIIALNH